MTPDMLDVTRKRHRHCASPAQAPIDEAWNEAEAALPEGWSIYGVVNRHRVYHGGPWEARADSHTLMGDVVYGRGPTPAAALTQLAAHLSALSIRLDR